MSNTKYDGQTFLRESEAMIAELERRGISGPTGPAILMVLRHLQQAVRMATLVAEERLLEIEALKADNRALVLRIEALITPPENA